MRDGLFAMGFVAAIALSVGLFAAGVTVLAMRWNGSVWSDECREVGGVVTKERVPSGAFEGDLHSCVVDGTPVSWERF
jgi:hypothetical protein